MRADWLDGEALRYECAQQQTFWSAKFVCALCYAAESAITTDPNCSNKSLNHKS